MNANLQKILIQNQTGHGPQTVQHRDFPEIRASGESVVEAAQCLENQLVRALDTALTNWRREALEQAIADVREFIAHSGAVA